MKKVTFKKDWKYAYRGVEVVRFRSGQSYELDDDVIDEARRCNVLSAAKKKAVSGAPRNKSRTND